MPRPSRKLSQKRKTPVTKEVQQAERNPSNETVEPELPNLRVEPEGLIAAGFEPERETRAGDDQALPSEPVAGFESVRELADEGRLSRRK